MFQRFGNSKLAMLAVLKHGGESGSTLLTDLVAYWNLDEASGTRNDSHTNGFHLTDTNTVGSTTGVGGSGTAADFIAANSERLTHADDALFDIGTSTRTFAFWARADDLTAARTFIGKGGIGPGGAYEIIVGTGGAILFRSRNAADAAANTQVSVGGFGSGSFRFVVASYDAGTDTASLRFNNGRLRRGPGAPTPMPWDSRWAQKVRGSLRSALTEQCRRLASGAAS